MESLVNKRLTDNNRDLLITEEKYIKKGEIQPNDITAKYSIMWYKFTCNKCGWDNGWMSRGHLISRKDRCPCCNGQKLVVGINDFSTTYPDLAILLKDKKDGLVKRSSGNKTIAICPECGYEKNIKLSSLAKKGFRCDCCYGGDSYPNKLMKSVLEVLSIDFIKEYSPKWIKPKRYDFYVPSLNLIIEMDGLQHDRDTNFKGRKINHEIIKANDIFKDKMAIKYGYKIVRIKCPISQHTKIKSSIIEQLDNYLDLDKVNWLKCEESARDSIVKKVCEFKKNNVELLSGDLAKIFKIGQSTITRYLKIGAEVGWCEYDVQKEKERNIERSKKRSKDKAKKIVVMEKDTNNILDIFESALELERLSLERFGVLFKKENVRYCCNNKSKRCYGYKVRYYEDVFDTVATTE